jgi:hypothetical protein
MKAVLWLAAASVVICPSFALSARWQTTDGHSYLELVLENRTGEQIDQTAIVLGENRCTSGILGRGAAKTYLGWQREVGTNAVVRWRFDNQTTRETTVSLVDIYRSSVDGRLIFTIMPKNAPTNVVVKFETIERRPAGN